MDNNHKSILITGGSGLVGTRLTEILLEKGYKVSHLSRKEDLTAKVKKYFWDPKAQKMDREVIKKVDFIINLAGAGVADERWTDERKKEILDSRIESAEMLFNSLKNINNQVKAIISASAIGYYGFGQIGDSFDEKSKPGSDFLATVTQKWENAIEKIGGLGIRIVKLRIGVVLTDKGGALPQMVTPIKFFAGSPLGSGNQMVSWIDLDDLCNMFIYAIENETMKGVFNAVAPNPVTNEQLTKAIGKILNRPIWPIKVPEFMLKVIVGEMETVVTGSCDVKNKRIKEETDFKYQFVNVEESLRHNLG
jgi:uncharacterized protein